MKEEIIKESVSPDLLPLEPFPNPAESVDPQLIRLLYLRGALPEPTKKAYLDYIKEAGKATLCRLRETSPQS